MKKLILGAILTAGAVLAQTAATPPAKSGASSTNGQKPATQAKKHRKAHTSANSANTNKSGSSSTGNSAAKPATPAK